MRTSSSRVMGSRLRTRMLWGAVLVSLVPMAFMFVFSYGLMNRAVDRWFSQPVTQMRDDSNRMALELSQYTTANAARGGGVDRRPACPAARPTRMRRTAESRSDSNACCSQHEITLQGGFVVVFRDGRPLPR